ncbi:MAG: UDP-glucose 4-epimerase GalE [Candidatus Aminicenantes bacterium]|nr:UDP-glucose 4-epimerase GalE [Candidatus Aminicenantes bacterium]
MTILVTGGAGYIGSICVEELLRQGHEVIVIDNLQEGHREAVCPQATFYEGDIGDRFLLDRLFHDFHIETVMHFAAEATVELSMKDPQIFFETNVAKGLMLLDVMKENGCNKMIFSSTAALFGNPEYVPIDEKHPEQPINAYGESKLMYERILEWYHSAYGLQYNSFRYFNAAGASEALGEAHKKESHLIPIILSTALGQRENLYIFGSDYPTKDGTCVRDYVHVIDIAQAHILGLDNLEKRPKAKYNLGNGVGFTNLEVLKTSEKVSGKIIPFEFKERRMGDPDRLVASSDLAKEELGWKPQFDTLESIIRSAWEWHSKHPDGYATRSS